MPDKKLFTTSLVIISILILWQNPFTTFGLSAEEAIPLCPYRDVDSEDVKNFEAFIFEKQDEFKVFTEDLFLKKSPNSILIPVGIKKYNDIKSQIEGKYELVSQFILVGTDSTMTDQYKKLATCKSIMTAELNNMYKPFEMHIRSTAQVKRTTVLLEKYQHINSKLRDLNQVLAETYGYYLTMQKKFKDFVPTCQK